MIACSKYCESDMTNIGIKERATGSQKPSLDKVVVDKSSNAYASHQEKGSKPTKKKG